MFIGAGSEMFIGAGSEMSRLLCFASFNYWYTS